MGTNYYFRLPGCDHCGHTPDDIHIGKRSGGWVFALCVHPDKGIGSLSDWRTRWLGGTGRIFNEYGDQISGEEMDQIILDVPHLGTLERAEIDGIHCIGHEDYCDICVGEFS